MGFYKKTSSKPKKSAAQIVLIFLFIRYEGPILHALWFLPLVLNISYFHFSCNLPAMSDFKCIFCPKVFPDNDSFWAHMSAGTCSSPQDQPPLKAPAASKPSTMPMQTDAPVPAPQIAPTPPVMPAFEVASASSQQPAVPSFNTFKPQPQLAAPQQQAPPARPAPPPPKQAGNNVSSLGSKWKCTLCKVSFTDKATLLGHVKSPEHEDKISQLNSPKSTPTQKKTPPTAPQQQQQPPPPPPQQQPPQQQQPAPPQPFKEPMFATPPSPPKPMQVEQSPVGATTNAFASSLQQDVRAIVMDVLRDELPKMLRSELRTMFDYMLAKGMPIAHQPPLAQGDGPSAPNSPNSKQVLTNGETNAFLEYRGTAVQCLACNCPLSSPSNLQSHLEGKKHKAKVEKLMAQRG